MALRFRTRLNLTIASLVFLVVTIMTFVVLVIFAWDMWRQGWNQGTFLTQITTTNIDRGMTASQEVQQALQGQLFFQGLLTAELVALAEASEDITDDDVADALDRALRNAEDYAPGAALGHLLVADASGKPLVSVSTEQRGGASAGISEDEIANLPESGFAPVIQQEETFTSLMRVPGTDGSRLVRLESSSMLLADSGPDYSPEGLLQRYMIEDLYRGMAIIRADGEITSFVGDLDMMPDAAFRRRAIQFCTSFLRSPPPENFSASMIGMDLGVVTPLQEVDGEYTHALFVMHNTSQQISSILDRLGVLVTVGFTLFMFAVVVGIFISRGLSKPLIELSRGAREFGAGNLNYRLRMRRKDEFNDLAQSFNTMAISIQEYVHELEQETSRRERLESEFRIAADLQRTLLPEAPPEVEELRLVGWSRPSKDVGGDFYDFIDLGQGIIAVVLGDATGKGLGAALLSTQCSSILRTLATRDIEPSELLRQTNNAFFDRIGATHRFVTLFLMVIDTNTGEVSYASAGHPPPMLVNAESEKAQWLESESGYPLGIVHDAIFSQNTLRLESMDTVVIYSDGLTDAQSQSRELYGEDRIERVLRAASGESCDAILDDLRIDADKHMDGKDPIDDMTVVVVRFHPPVAAPVTRPSTA